MKKKQFGKLIYLLAIVLLLVFGFVLPAMRQSDTADAGAAEKTLQVVEEDAQDTSGIEISEEEAEAEVTENVSDTKTLDVQQDLGITEDGQYSSKDEVALYLHTYGHLPSNYITKNEAKELGWGDKGTLNKVAPGMSIGGDKFGNREGLLPTAKGRKYYECDIDYKKGGRNAKRIIYSNDGLIFYTDDHYESFEQLY